MKKQATLFSEKETPVLKELNLSKAENIANQIKTAICSHCDRLEVAGSIRRKKPVVHDIDFVAVAKNDAEWKRINEELKCLKAKPGCAGDSIIKAYLPCQDVLFQVDLYRAKPSTFGVHLLIRTGSAEHNMWLAAYAILKGMRLKYSEGLIKENSVIAGEDEKGVFAALGLPYALPTEREIVENRPVWLITQNVSPQNLSR
jgi:DNA polymerase/3'-5' exonuclease PolX